MTSADLGALLLYLTAVLGLSAEQAVATAVCVLLAYGAEAAPEPGPVEPMAAPHAAPAA